MKLRRIVVAILMAPPAAAFGLGAWIASRWDRRHRRARARIRRAPGNLGAASAGLVARPRRGILSTTLPRGPSWSRKRGARFNRTWRPRTGPGSVAFFHESTVIRQWDCGRSSPGGCSGNPGLVPLPWPAAAWLSWLFGLGSFNTLTQLLVKAYPEGTFPGPARRLPSARAFWWSEQLRPSRPRPGDSAARPTRTRRRPTASRPEGGIALRGWNPCWRLGRARRWPGSRELMEALTATLAAEQRRQAEESASRERMRHGQLVKIELAAMALFHISLFFAAAMTGAEACPACPVWMGRTRPRSSSSSRIDSARRLPARLGNGRHRGSRFANQLFHLPELGPSQVRGGALRDTPPRERRALFEGGLETGAGDLHVGAGPGFGQAGLDLLGSLRPILGLQALLEAVEGPAVFRLMLEVGEVDLLGAGRLLRPARRRRGGGGSRAARWAARRSAGRLRARPPVRGGGSPCRLRA